jgi:hypothetical protein
MHWSAPYSIVFDNDSASISADADGVVNSTTLAEVSAVNVTVYHGTENITADCTFSWTVSGGTLNNNNTASIKFTALNSDTATATITVNKNGELVGTKAFVISKSKQAATYKLSAEPTSWNKTDSNTIRPAFTVIKYGAGDPITITSGYTIKIGSTIWNNTAISTTTVFDLYIGNEKVDSETVTAITGLQNIVNWYKAHSSDTEAPAGNGESGGWSTTTPTLNSTTNKYLWGYEVITYNEDKVETTDKHYITAHGDTGVHGTEAEAIRIFISSTTNSAPATPADGLGDWSTSEISASDEANFVFTSTGIRKTEYDESGNSTTTYGDWTTPELWDAYLNENVNGERYATYMKLLGENSNKNGLYYTDSGALYINASYLDANTITVMDGTEVVFSADSSEKTVSMAGWLVDNNSIRTGSLSSGMWLCSSGTTSYAAIGGSKNINGWSIAVGGSFGVTSGGALYASSANITGTITATGGYIGDWSIGTSGISKSITSGSDTYVISINAPSTKGSDAIVITENDEYTFYLEGDGTLFANKASIEGTITATGGYIGDWSIGTSGISKSITSGSDTYSININAPSSSGSDVISITKNGSYTFYLEGDGTLWASDATITGDITADSLVANTEGIIAGWMFDSDGFSRTVAT